MPKHIIKYKLHGKETPWYIEEAGLYYLDGWYYGVSYDDDLCYIPSEVEKLTENQMTTELKKHTYTKDGKNLTDKEKEDHVKDRMKLTK